MATLQRIKNVFIESLKILPTSFNEDLGAGDIPEWDSLGHLRLILAIEKEFAIKFSQGEMMASETVKDLLDLIESKLMRQTS